MNGIERRALYNLLRMNWLNEPTLAVEPWQVEDYRLLSLPELFDRLSKFQFQLNKESFAAYSNECDSPEDFTDHLIADRPVSPADEDQIYLIIFELWRRIMGNKPSVSIICNELDYQIHLYDQQQLKNPSDLQNALIRFLQMLDENINEGISSEQVIKLISPYCANDIETFLYDFISEQIDEGNETYVHELLDDFATYLNTNKWFKLLQLRLSHGFQDKIGQRLIQEMIEEHIDDRDLDFSLELLSILGEKRFDSFFRLLIKQMLPLIQREEELQDLLAIAIDFFHQLNQEQHEKDLNIILNKHTSIPFDKAIQSSDPDIVYLNKLF